MIIFLLSLFIILNCAESNPHSYRRHHSYYHHRSPYHVNYSPYSLPKHSFFGVESSIYNDLDDHNSNEAVKGGVKNPTIKTPMKLFSERKNVGYLSSSLGSYQEKLSGIKRTNQNSIKQSQSFQESSSIIYPNSDLDLNDSSSIQPNLGFNEKKIEHSIKQNINSNAKRRKITTTTTTSTTTQKPTQSTTTEKSIKIVSTKSTISSTTEQPPTTLNSINVIENLEIKDVKVDNVAISETSVLKTNTLNDTSIVSKSQSDLIKPSTIDKIEITKLDTVIIKPEEIKEKTAISNQNVVKVESSTIMKSENKIVETVSTVTRTEISNLTNPIDVKQDIPIVSLDAKIELNNLNRSSVDVIPLSVNTENSLALESETNSPLVN